MKLENNHKNQNSFRRNLSSNSEILSFGRNVEVMQVKKKKKKKKTRATLMSIDFTKAFDLI